MIIDDPIKNSEEAASETIREKHWEWWQSTLSTRLEPGCVVILMMTRWNQADLLGRVLRAAAGRIDIVLTGDDFGAQNGLLISADMWRRFIRPGFAEYVSLVKRHKAIAMHHTCGSVVDIIPDMIECQLDILQSIQPEANGMSLANLKKLFGENICFHGGVSIQRTMPYGSREEIRREVKSIADIARQDGGYIFCTSHNIQADTPLENIVTLMDAYLHYGRM